MIICTAAINICESFLKQVELGLSQAGMLKHLLHFGGSNHLIDLEKTGIGMIPNFSCLVLITLQSIVKTSLKVNT
jgi:hypothetical protein